MTPQEKREKARERKRKQRDRERAHKEACGAHTINFELYQGTRQCMDELMQAGGFEEQGELMTRLIHGAHRDLLRDESRFNELVKV